MIAIEPKPIIEEWDSDPVQDDSYDPNYKREKFGNNKKKVKGMDVKRKRKIALISKRKNRK